MITRLPIRRSSSCHMFYFYCCLCTIVILLSGLQFSSATFNPMYNPLQQHHQSYYPDYNEYDNNNGYYDQNQQRWDEGESIRGGSTMTVPNPEQTMSQPIEQEQAEEPFHPPKVLLKHMSMALRVTCEWNRRIFAGVNRTFQMFNKKHARIRNDAHPQQPPPSMEQSLPPQMQPSQDSYYRSDPAQPPHQLQLEPYGDRPVNIHPDRTWSPPIAQGGPDLEQDSLTIFHAMTPHEHEEEEEKQESSSSNDEAPKPRGVAYWGPELLPYLEQVTSLLQIDNNGLEIALAMIYLDRACSVDTIRSNDCPPCPFCLPRTVHRLSLVALILAKQAVSGNSAKTVQEYLQDLEPLGIPLDQLELMTNWMINALGDNGSFVTVGQMKLWSENWEAAFFPRRHRALQLKRQEEERQRLLQLEQQQLEQQRQQHYEQGYHRHQAYNQGYQEQEQYYQ